MGTPENVIFVVFRIKSPAKGGRDGSASDVLDTHTKAGCPGAQPPCQKPGVTHAL